MTDLSTNVSTDNTQYIADRNSTMHIHTGSSMTTNNYFSPTGPLSPNLIIQPQHQLERCPIPSLNFVVRQAIFDTMVAFFFNSTALLRKIFVLHGLGGSGKSQLAFYFADQFFYRLSEESRHFSEVYYVDATTLDTIHRSLENIALALGLGQDPTRALKKLANQTGKDANWLMIYNNADDNKIDLNLYFPQCTHGNILITSRIAETRVYGADCVVSNLDPSEALELLLKNKKLSEHDADLEVAKTLVKELGCFALSISMASAVIAKNRAIGLRGYLKRYQEGPQALIKQHKSLSGQGVEQYPYRSVQEAWSISYEQLAPHSRLFLQLCSFFHHEGLSQTLIERMCTRTHNFELDPIIPFTDYERGGYKAAKDFAAHFCSERGEWDDDIFSEIINNLCNFSLITFDESQTCSIHPLVHEWGRTMCQSQDETFASAAFLLSSATNARQEKTEYPTRKALIPHIDKLLLWKEDVHDHCMTIFAAVYQSLSRFDTSQRLAKKTVERRKAKLGEDTAHTAEAYSALALTYEGKKDWDEAFSIYEHALKIWQKLENQPRILSSQERLVDVYCKKGNFQDAETLFEKVVEERKAAVDDYRSHRPTLYAIAQLATIYAKQQKWEKADQLDCEVIDALEGAFGKDDSQRLYALANRAMSLSTRKKHEEAISILEGVVLDLRRTVGDTNPDTLSCISKLAVVNRSAGKWERYIALQKEVISGKKAVQGEDNPDTIESLKNLAQAEGKLKNWPEAVLLYQTVVDALRARLGNNDPETLEALLMLAFGLQKNQQNTLALRAFKEVLDANILDSSKKSIKAAKFHLVELQRLTSL